MCVRAYVCVRVCECMCMYVCLCECMCVCVCAGVCVCVYVLFCLLVYVCVCQCERDWSLNLGLHNYEADDVTSRGKTLPVINLSSFPSHYTVLI